MLHKSDKLGEFITAKDEWPLGQFLNSASCTVCGDSLFWVPNVMHDQDEEIDFLSLKAWCCGLKFSGKVSDTMVVPRNEDGQWQV